MAKTKVKKIMPRKKQIKADGVPVHCSFDEIVKLVDLQPNPDNPNSHPDEQIELLAKMIKGNGWRERITVSNQSGFIVKGHGRLLAAIRAGLKKAPVDFQDYKTVDHEWADLVGDNKIAELSVFDEDAIINLTKNLNNGFDLNLFGFGDIDKIIETGGGDELIKRLEAETETEQDIKDFAEEVKNNITSKLEAIINRNPAEMKNAQAVIISSVKNCNDYFILADPNLKDFIIELKRYSKNKVKSPLEKVLKRHYSMK
jgi:hypothetical protein